MNMIIILLSVVFTLILFVVFLPLANAFISAMGGLFNSSVFVALNALVLCVIFFGVFSIMNKLTYNEREVSAL